MAGARGATVVAMHMPLMEAQYDRGSRGTVAGGGAPVIAYR